MQHVLRCWERQSDGSECKKNLRLRPGPRWGRLQQTPSCWVGVGCPLPKNPIPPLSDLSYPTPKLVSTPLPFVMPYVEKFLRTPIVCKKPTLLAMCARVCVCGCLRAKSTWNSTNWSIREKTMEDGLSFVIVATIR